MDWDVPMDSRLRKGMRSMPTKQNSNPQEKNTTLPYHHERRHSPLSTNCDGPYHRTSAASRTQRHTNHSRPWMLLHSYLPPVFRHNHRPRNCPTLSRLRLPMVWVTNQNDKRLRP